VLLWVLLACHPLPLHSHYMVDSRVILSPHLQCQQGETPSKPVESHARVFPFARDVIRGNPFLDQYNPMQGLVPSQGGPAGGNPIFPSGNQMGGGYPPFNQSQQGFTQSFGPSTNSSWKPGASYNPGPSFQATNQSMMQPRLPFLETLHFPYLSKLMNDPIHHDPSWPAVPTKLPSDIPKFKGKSGKIHRIM
jgi:hypothetical protein